MYTKIYSWRYSHFIFARRANIKNSKYYCWRRCGSQNECFILIRNITLHVFICGDIFLIIFMPPYKHVVYVCIFSYTYICMYYVYAVFIKVIILHMIYFIRICRQTPLAHCIKGNDALLP